MCDVSLTEVLCNIEDMRKDIARAMEIINRARNTSDGFDGVDALENAISRLDDGVEQLDLKMGEIKRGEGVLIVDVLESAEIRCK